LFVHWARRAASRAAWTAGNKSAINTAMMAITTKSSISVNPRRGVLSVIRFSPHSFTIGLAYITSDHSDHFDRMSQV
jgi:hypothetical protein